MQTYKSLKKKQNLFKKYYFCIGSLSSLTHYVMSGLSLPLCKKRGLFVTATGKLINADANGALNIARLGLSVSENEMQISDSVMSCVSQPKKLNILYNKIEQLKHFDKK